MKIAFIGLGSMGAAMARNLLNAGHQLTVYNRTRSRADELLAAGARIADTPAQAAEKAEIAITMLADDHALEDTVFGDNGLMKTLPQGSIHAGMSTVSVAISRRLTEAHTNKGQHYVAAPVFGRPDAAAAAKLFIVAAGDQQQIERLQPVLAAMGQKTFIAGPDQQMANVVKLAGNFLITSVIESMAEAFALGRKFNIQPAQLLEIFTNSLFPAPVYKNYGGMIAAERFEPAGFKLKHGAKDNRLVLAAAEEVSVPMPTASLVRDHFVSAVAQGMADIDWAAIAKLVYQNAGL
ncbi:MAG TPA: NAD(P)-dependent oxidoreductase [Candidatus Limnocylindrales bacterium]|nr:NAD(P)-dependent oxidoreductase [Candidatus Limnocylindrales bacterium]